MNRSEYTANLSLANTHIAAPASWMRPAPVRATRALAAKRHDQFMCLLLGVSALSIVAAVTLVIGAI